jgi:hypothetical protein
MVIDSLARSLSRPPWPTRGLSAEWTHAYDLHDPSLALGGRGLSMWPRRQCRLADRPAVTIYSVARLYPEDPVVEEALPGDDGARNIVIPEDLDIRVEHG